jgi:hypothetical protein
MPKGNSFVFSLFAARRFIAGLITPAAGLARAFKTAFGSGVVCPILFGLSANEPGPSADYPSGLSMALRAFREWFL